MISVFAAVKKYSLGEPWLEAAAELALHGESSLMKQGEYAIAEHGPTFKFPPIKFAFTSEAGVIVSIGDDFACFLHNEITYCFWRIAALAANTTPDPEAA